jgi:glycosyltransferase involved in cell wall biosynthesis
MLSVCIPIYNYDVTNLLADLHGQVKQLNVPAEIICIDDCSSNPFREKNNDACNIYSTYIQLECNVGRARIRNLFLDYAHYENLLFLDCDSVIVNPHFLQKYINAIHQDCQVICGGRIYDNKKPVRQNLLRWQFGRKRESLKVDARSKHPNRSFMTNNFMINRDTLMKIKFEERLLQYGHEDTLFGFQLKLSNICVKHIDNPILNGHLEQNTEFIEKTEHGLQNLVYILSYVNHDHRYMNDVSLLNVYRGCRKNHLTPVITFVFGVSRSLLKRMLSSGFAGLWLFDFYKLGFFTSLNGRKTSPRPPSKGD